MELASRTTTMLSSLFLASARVWPMTMLSSLASPPPKSKVTSHAQPHAAPKTWLVYIEAARFRGVEKAGKKFWFYLLLLVRRERPGKLTSDAKGSRIAYVACGNQTPRGRGRKWLNACMTGVSWFLSLITACSKLLEPPISPLHNCFTEPIHISRKVLPPCRIIGQICILRQTLAINFSQKNLRYLT
jgi:hypothetical protein